MDEDLRRRFDRLRDEEARSRPGYAALVARDAAQVRKRTLPGRAWFALPASAVLVLVLWLVLAPFLAPSQSPSLSPMPPRPFEPGQWAMPTDVLLRTPGSELLGPPPVFGAPLELPSAPTSMQSPWPSPWRNSG